MDKQRDFGLDLTRAAAAALVLGVHFFLNTGFYELPLRGGFLTLCMALRMAFSTCVPLFMMLSGYLCIHREWKRGYVRGLLPVLLIYLLAAVACLAYRAIFMNLDFTLTGALRRLLEFSAAPYGWYVEMYVGLYLLSPFFNAAWHALEQRARGALVLTLLFLTALPAALNCYRQLLPQWWIGIYPLTYYALGAWLRERPLRLKSGYLALLFLGAAAVSGAVEVWLAGGAAFAWRASNDWGSLWVVIESVCLFTILCRCKGEKTPKPLRRCVARASRLSLPIYLMSFITDQIIYPPLCAAFPTMAGRLPFLPVMVLTSLLLSGVLGQLVQWMAEALLRLLPARREQMSE